MSERPRAVRVDGKGPSYPTWKCELLAELALIRVFEFTIHRRFSGPAGPEHDFLVTAPDGASCLVDVKGFSSHHLKLRDVVASLPELGWAVQADVVRKARQSPTPVVMFLYDADTEHGRFARLDTLPEPDWGTRRVVVAFPVENTITPESLRALVAGLRRPEPAATG